MSFDPEKAKRAEARLQELQEKEQQGTLTDIEKLDLEDRREAEKTAKNFKLLFRNPEEDRTTRIKKIYDFCENFQKENHIYFDTHGRLWLWENDRYELQENDVKLWKLLKDAGVNEIIISSCREQVMTALKIASCQNQPKELPINWVVFKNAVVNVITTERLPISPDYFVCNPIPWNLPEKLGEEANPTPNIDKLFKSWVPDGVKRLKEIVAYCLLANYPIHRFFWLVGSGRNGKGSFLRCIRKTIGDRNCTSSNLELLAKSRFESGRLYKKLLCECGESNFKELSETATLKSITGGDRIPGEIKNGAHFEFLNYAKIIVAANSLPKTTDKTIAWYARSELVEFTGFFENGKDVIASIPEAEFSAFCGQAIPILKDLLDREGFTGSVSLSEKEAQYERLSNPLIRFLAERTKEDPDGKISVYSFHSEYQTYLRHNGFRVLSDREITADLNERGFTEEQNRKGKRGEIREEVGADGKTYPVERRIWFLLGIRWLTHEEIEASKESKKSSIHNPPSLKKVEEEGIVHGLSGCSGRKEPKKDGETPKTWSEEEQKPVLALLPGAIKQLLRVDKGLSADVVLDRLKNNYPFLTVEHIEGAISSLRSQGEVYEQKAGVLALA